MLKILYMRTYSVKFQFVFRNEKASRKVVICVRGWDRGRGGDSFEMTGRAYLS